MTIGADRYGSRADTLVFLACVALSVAAMSVPQTWRDPIAKALRQTVLAPLLDLQEESELLRTSKARFAAIEAQRDSAALAATFLPELRSENARLRGLLGLENRLPPGYVAAEVLPQSLPTSPPAIVTSAGAKEGVKPLAAALSPEGLVGIVGTVDAHTSVVVTWAHPEFRASAMTSDGSVYGIVAPHGTAGGGVWLLELRGVPYRQNVPEGTLVLTSGLGGVFPRGIPIGTVVGVVATNEEWEKTYILRPAVHPAAVSHLIILTGPHAGGDLRSAFEAAGEAP